MPGYGDGPGASPFPRSWILPEENDPFIRHVREERLRRGSNQHLLGLYGLSSASPPPPPQHSQHPPHPPHSPGTPLPTYILKPSGGSEGAGILLVQHEGHVPQHAMRRKAIAQEYLPPLLFGGVKFDLRFYVALLATRDESSGALRIEAFMLRFAEQGPTRIALPSFSCTINGAHPYSVRCEDDGTVRSELRKASHRFTPCQDLAARRVRVRVRVAASPRHSTV